jgi:hypothetical protein
MQTTGKESWMRTSTEGGNLLPVGVIDVGGEFGREM